eukprot:352904-Chlamydomonas_euryale.AAC.2
MEGGLLHVIVGTVLSPRPARMWPVPAHSHQGGHNAPHISFPSLPHSVLPSRPVPHCPPKQASPERSSQAGQSRTVLPSRPVPNCPP